MITRIPPAVSRIESAVFRLPRCGGQGVLVPGGFVLTAAHCLGWTAEGWMALGEDPRAYELIVATDGRDLTVAPYAIEPVSDIAVLGAVDEQACPDLAEAFEDFCANTRPVPIALDEVRMGIARRAFLFTHDKRILPVRATQVIPGASVLMLSADEGVESGTSGGPVVTREGKLLGILSSSRKIAHVHLATPAWLIRQMIPEAHRRRLDRSLPPGRKPSIRSLVRRLAKRRRATSPQV